MSHKRNTYAIPYSLHGSDTVLGDFSIEGKIKANVIRLGDDINFSFDAVEALENYQQADADGTMVTVSRQALEEVLPALRFLKEIDKD